MHNTIESSKYFPYVAWILVISFALFTYSLTLRMQEELSSISDGVERLEQKINDMDTQKQASTTAPITTAKAR